MNICDTYWLGELVVGAVVKVVLSVTEHGVTAGVLGDRVSDDVVLSTSASSLLRKNDTHHWQVNRHPPAHIEVVARERGLCESRDVGVTDDEGDVAAGGECREPPVTGAAVAAVVHRCGGHEAVLRAVRAMMTAGSKVIGRSSPAGREASTTRTWVGAA